MLVNDSANWKCKKVKIENFVIKPGFPGAVLIYKIQRLAIHNHKLPQYYNNDYYLYNIK